MSLPSKKPKGKLLRFPRVPVPKPMRVVPDKRKNPPKHKTNWDRLDEVYQ